MDNLLKSEGLKAASGIATQLIAISTGAVAFTVTFLEKFTTHQEHIRLPIPTALYVSWAFFGLTVLFSLVTLMAITGTLQALDRKANNWPLSEADKFVSEGAGGNVQRPAMLMLGSFFVAVAAMIWTGIQLGP